MRADADDPRLLVARLEDPNQLFVAHGLILARGRETVPALASLLLGTPSVLWQGRAAAAECLAALGGDAAVDALQRVLTVHDSRKLTPATRLAEFVVRNVAARGLGRLRALDAVPALRSALTSERLSGAATALAEMGDVASVRGIVALLEEPFPHEASRALLTFGSAAVPVLCDTLDGSTSESREPGEAPRVTQRRRIAAEILGEIGGGATLPVLRRHLHDPASAVRSACASALAKHGVVTTDVLRVIATALDADDVTTRIEAVELLEAGGAVTISGVAGIVDRLSVEARRTVASILGRTGVRPAIPVLRRLLHDDDPQVRCGAIFALAKLPFADVEPIVDEMRHDPAAAVRGAVRAVLRRRRVSH